MAPLAFELGLLGFAIALLYYGMALRFLGRLVGQEGGTWILPMLGALAFGVAAGLHAWGAFALEPQLLGVESALNASLSAGHLESLDILQMALDKLLALKGKLRDLSLWGMAGGSALALVSGLAHLRAIAR